MQLCTCLCHYAARGGSLYQSSYSNMDYPRRLRQASNGYHNSRLTQHTKVFFTNICMYCRHPLPCNQNYLAFYNPLQDAAERETTHIDPGHSSPVNDYTTGLNLWPQRFPTTIYVPQKVCCVTTQQCGQVTLLSIPIDNWLSSSCRA